MYPPAYNPRVLEEIVDVLSDSVACIESPKSVAFPAVEIVIKSIVFTSFAGEVLPL